MPYLGVIYLAIVVLALIDILCAEGYRVRGLPRAVWFLLVILLPLIGSLAWVFFGRPTYDPRQKPRGAGAQFPEYDRPGRYVPADPEADAAFLQQLRDRAEDQRRRAREQRETREE